MFLNCVQARCLVQAKMTSYRNDELILIYLPMILQSVGIALILPISTILTNIHSLWRYSGLLRIYVIRHAMRLIVRFLDTYPLMRAKQNMRFAVNGFFWPLDAFEHSTSRDRPFVSGPRVISFLTITPITVVILVDWRI